MNLGVLYRGDGRLTEAIAAHAAAAKIAPGYSGVHEKLGNHSRKRELLERYRAINCRD